MDHTRHVAGTVAECEECRRIAVEPGWYKRLSGEEDAPKDVPVDGNDPVGASAEPSGERPADRRRDDRTSRRGPATGRDVDLAAAELERRRMRVDLSRAEEGATRVDLPDHEERERATPKGDRSE